jgi:hypothetical protein
MMSLVLPELRIAGEEDQGAAMARRLAEALHPDKGEGSEPEETETELDAAMTFSDREQLRGMDFEKMSLEELARAKAAITRLRLPVQDVRTRRFAPDRHGARADLRATLRAALRGRAGSSEAVQPAPASAAARRVATSPADEPLQPHLSAFHALGHQHRDRVHTFVFGTRLTTLPAIRHHRDVDLALSERGRRGGCDLRRDHRARAAEFNPVVAPAAQPGATCSDHRRADRDAGTGLAHDGSAPPVVPPADRLNPVALRGFRAKISRKFSAMMRPMSTSSRPV